MPAPRAVLTDLEASGLNPLKAHIDISDNGHLKSATAPAPKKAEKPAKKAPEPSKAEKKVARPAADEPKEVVVEVDEKKPARRAARRPKTEKGDN